MHVVEFKKMIAEETGVSSGGKSLLDFVLTVRQVYKEFDI